MTAGNARTKKSTTVRTFNRLVLTGGLRAIFRILEHLAPAVGARLALRLWCTPPRQRGLPRPAANTGRPGGAPATGDAFTVAAGGATVVGRTWGAGPVVYLAHGWGGSAGQFQGFVAPLVAAGYQVVAWDAPSHGRSGPGRLGPHRSTLPEFADALTAVVRAHGPAHAIVAHSLGGAAAGLAILDGLPVDRLVLIAAMADPLRYAGRFRHALGIGDAVGRRFVDRMAALVGRPTADLDIAGRAGRTGDLPPLLVLHDRDDREIEARDGTALAAAWPGELHSTTGLGHLRILGDAEVIERVVGFVRDHPRAELRRDAAGQAEVSAAAHPLG